MHLRPHVAGDAPVRRSRRTGGDRLLVAPRAKGAGPWPTCRACRRGHRGCERWPRPRRGAARRPPRGTETTSGPREARAARGCRHFCWDVLLGSTSPPEQYLTAAVTALACGSRRSPRAWAARRRLDRCFGTRTGAIDPGTRRLPDHEPRGARRLRSWPSPNASKVALLAYRASKATLPAFRFGPAAGRDRLLVAPRAKGAGAPGLPAEPAVGAAEARRSRVAQRSRSDA